MQTRPKLVGITTESVPSRSRRFQFASRARFLAWRVRAVSFGVGGAVRGDHAPPPAGEPVSGCPFVVARSTLDRSEWCSVKSSVQSCWTRGMINTLVVAFAVLLDPRDDQYPYCRFCALAGHEG